MTSKRARRAEKHAVRLEACKARHAATAGFGGQAASGNASNFADKKANSSLAREVASLTANPTDNPNMTETTQRRTRGVQIDFVKADKEMVRDDNFYQKAKLPDDGRASHRDFYRPQISRTNRAERAECLGATARNLQKKYKKPPKNENPGNTVKKDGKPVVGVANNLLADYLAKNPKFNFETLKEWVEDGVAAYRPQLLGKTLSENKKRKARIFAFLQTDLNLRDELTEKEFRKILDQVDKGEAKRSTGQLPPTKAQRKAARYSSRRTKEQRQLEQEANNRARLVAQREEQSLADSLRNFGLQTEQATEQNIDVDMDMT